MSRAKQTCRGLLTRMIKAIEPVESDATSEGVALMLDRGEVLTTIDLCDDPFAYTSAILSHVARRRRQPLVDRVAKIEDDLLARYGA